MAKLQCVRHRKRVQVINIGTDENRIPLVVHRSNSKRNDVCDSNTLVIDWEYFTPDQVIADDWSDNSDLIPDSVTDKMEMAG